MRRACQITLNDADRLILERRSRGRSTQARLVSRRARHHRGGGWRWLCRWHRLAIDERHQGIQISGLLAARRFPIHTSRYGRRLVDSGSVPAGAFY